MSVTPYEFRNQYSKRVVMIDDSLCFGRCRMAVWQSIHSSQHFQKVYMKPYHQSQRGVMKVDLRFSEA